MVTIADIACGAGMASLGLCEALDAMGFAPRIVLAVDPWTPAVDSYRENLAPYLSAPDVVRQATAESLTRMPHVDILVSGPPCIRDSTMARNCHGVTDDTASQVKASVHEITSARLSVMETVGKGWVSWAKARGYDVHRVRDCDLGGFTIRRRTLLVKTNTGFSITGSPRVGTHAGWGDALPDMDRRLLMGSEGDRVSKRFHNARTYVEPAHSVLGHGAAHLLFNQHGERVKRLTPRQGAALSGFPKLRLVSPRVRDRQTLVGNGWPRSFGTWVAHAYVQMESM